MKLLRAISEKIDSWGGLKYARFVVVAAPIIAVAFLWAANSSGDAFAAGKTLYVSSSAGSDSNPCTHSQRCRTISHAISVVGPHGRIIVESGTYPEMVTVTQAVTLLGQYATIDASGRDNGILITGPSAAGTAVQGFTVENATFEGILAVETSQVRIEGNVVQNNDQGATSPNPVGECAPQGQVPGDCGEGLHLWAVTHSHVVGNDVSHNVGGILLTDETGPTYANVIAKNHVTDNVEDCGITLPSHNPLAMTDPSMGGVYDNWIVGNVSEGNGGAGVGMFAPFPGAASYNNKVIGNYLKDNGEGGVLIHSHTPDQNVSGNVIVGNVIAGNGIDPDAGSTHPNGISVFSAVDQQHETIVANRISDEYYGIFIAGPITIHGLASNHFDSSVTVPVQS
jgi:nitrous oxidase accessory protein NosD